MGVGTEVYELASCHRVLDALARWGREGRRPCLSLLASDQWSLRLNAGSGGRQVTWRDRTPDGVVSCALHAERSGEFCAPLRATVQGVVYRS